MWDQLTGSVCIIIYHRIIPTYVGSTGCRRCRFLCRSNHSHVCWINDLQPGHRCTYFESFPRMWVQPVKCLDRPLRHRIIPTYVGSTGRIPQHKRHVSNHSHVCGINLQASFNRLAICESFPRMWDQRVHNLSYEFAFRIIPTYVGSTWFMWRSCKNFANHSHVCGINHCAGLRQRYVFESFPRMWDQQRY